MRDMLTKLVGYVLIFSMLGLLLTGCSGKQTEAMTKSPQEQAESQSSEQDLDAENQTEGEEVETEKETEAEADDSSSDDFSEWEPFKLESGQFFKYATKITEADGTVKEGWFTLKISGDSETEVTIESEGENAGDSFSFKTTGDKDNALGMVMMNMMTNPASQHVFSTLYSPFMGGGAWLMGLAQGQAKVGNHWSYTADGHSITTEVVEKRKYAGIEGYYLRSTVDEEIQSEVCMSPDFPLALMSSFKAGDILYESELVEYKAG